MKRAAILMCLAALSACDMPAGTGGAGRADPGPVMPENDTCAAAPHADLIGQDATALERVLIMRPVRVIRPGMAVTMDYRPDRINFDISEENRISRIHCG